MGEAELWYRKLKGREFGRLTGAWEYTIKTDLKNNV
jgi:hypothetical protein